jgi:hypothetical protein
MLFKELNAINGGWGTVVVARWFWHVSCYRTSLSGNGFRFVGIWPLFCSLQAESVFEAGTCVFIVLGVLVVASQVDFWCVLDIQPLLGLPEPFGPLVGIGVDPFFPLLSSKTTDGMFACLHVCMFEPYQMQMACLQRANHVPSCEFI